MNGPRWRLAAYTLVVAVAAGGAWRMESTVNRLDEVVRDNEAQRCVDEWIDDEEDRRLSPLAVRGLILFAGEEADPADVARIESIMADLVDREIIAPECDLAAAQARLDQ